MIPNVCLVPSPSVFSSSEQFQKLTGGKLFPLYISFTRLTNDNGDPTRFRGWAMYPLGAWLCVWYRGDDKGTLRVLPYSYRFTGNSPTDFRKLWKLSRGVWGTFLLILSLPLIPPQNPKSSFVSESWRSQVDSETQWQSPVLRIDLLRSLQCCSIQGLPLVL